MSGKFVFVCKKYEIFRSFVRFFFGCSATRRKQQVGQEIARQAYLLLGEDVPICDAKQSMDGGRIGLIRTDKKKERQMTDERQKCSGQAKAS